jgi:hypothetical protein
VSDQKTWPHHDLCGTGIKVTGGCGSPLTSLAIK